MCLNSSIDDIIIKVLDDKIKGKEVNWNEKKVRNEILAESYKRLGNEKYYRVRDCSTFLEFKRFEDNSLKLNRANFCRIRLCPLCVWRRSLKIFGQVSKIMNEMEKEKEYSYLFLTLTCKNVLGSELKNVIDELFKGFNVLTRNTRFKKAVKGYFRALEVTHNLNKKSKSYDTYHPHFHVILVINNTYFNDSKYYISQKEWTKIWKDSMKLKYSPIVYIQKYKGFGSGVAEVAKYTVKDNDYLVVDEMNNIDENMTDKAVEILDIALANRRLISVGGKMREVHKMMNLDDMVEGDLVNTDNEEIREDLGYIIEQYNWSIGYKQYVMIK